MLHYDDFNVKENHQSYGVNLSYMRAERVLCRILRKGIDPLRIEFYYTTCVPAGYTHKELLSTDNRLEFWLYELPSLQEHRLTSLLFLLCQGIIPPTKTLPQRLYNRHNAIPKKRMHLVTGVTHYHPHSAQNKPTLNFKPQCEQTLVFST